MRLFLCVAGCAAENSETAFRAYRAEAKNALRRGKDKLSAPVAHIVRIGAFGRCSLYFAGLPAFALRQNLLFS